MTRVEVFGDATLYLGDCREVAPSLQRPSALIGDPPYGQAQHTNIWGANKKRVYPCGAVGGGQRVLEENRRNRNGVLRGTGRIAVFPEEMHGDDKPFDPTPWLNVADTVLLWGVHKFADRLPPGQWLVWDKVPTGKSRDQGDGEAAWLNADRPMRIYRLLWDGVCVGSAARHEVMAGQHRVHPMQKPVALMRWCITQAMVPPGGTILDPWMGGGSMGIAAIQAGHPFVGIEIEPRYFDIACRRIEQAQRQRDLFAPAASAVPAASHAELFPEAP